MWGYPRLIPLCVIVALLTIAAPAQAWEARVGDVRQVGLEFRAGGVTAHATRVLSERRDGGVYTATLATDDPAGRTIAVRIARDELQATGPDGAEGMTARFAR